MYHFFCPLLSMLWVDILFGGIIAVYDQNGPEKKFDSSKTTKMRAFRHILVKIHTK